MQCDRAVVIQAAQQTLRPDGTFQNSAISRVGSENDNINGDGRLTFSKRFNQAGRSIIAEAWGELSSPDRISDLNTSTQFSDGQGGVTTRDILQTQRRESQTFTITVDSDWAGTLTPAT